MRERGRGLYAIMLAGCAPADLPQASNESEVSRSVTSDSPSRIVKPLSSRSR